MTASTFLLAGLLALRLASEAPRAQRPVWWVLAAGVLLVSLDEAVGASDPVRVAVQRLVDAGGPALLLVGVLGAGALAVAAVVVQVLPPPARFRAIAAVLLVLLAAVGIDELGPDLVDRPEERLRAWYVAKATTEEAVELAAAVLLLDAMLLATRWRVARRRTPPPRLVRP